MIEAIFGSTLLKYAIGLVLSILGILGARAKWKNDGRMEERANAKNKDYERAKTIRDSVRDDLPDRVRKHDDSGYRD